jgi:GT2 family glycosyltransferase
MVDYVPGTAVVVRAAVFHRVGLLDEAYFFAGELADLCRRAGREGYVSAIHLEALAEHHLDRSAPRRGHLYAYYVLRNRFLFVQKFHGGERGRLYALWTSYGLALWAAHLLRGRWQQARAIRLALTDGLAGRFGDQNERVLGHGLPGPSRR